MPSSSGSDEEEYISAEEDLGFQQRFGRERPEAQDAPIVQEPREADRNEERLLNVQGLVEAEEEESGDSEDVEVGSHLSSEEESGPLRDSTLTEEPEEAGPGYLTRAGRTSKQTR